MKKKLMLMVFVALTGYIQLNAQTLNEILSKHVTAIGGKSVIESITSQHWQIELSVMDTKMNIDATLLVGKAYKSVATSDVFVGEIVQCVKPGSGWTINALQGQLSPVPMPEKQVKESQDVLYVGGALVNYQKTGSKLSLVGKVKYEGFDVYKIKLIRKDGTINYFYLDAKDFYLIRQEVIDKADGKEMLMATMYADYQREGNGFVMPHTISNMIGETNGSTISIKAVEFNQPVDERIFDRTNY